jgi:universal stress protein E
MTAFSKILCVVDPTQTPQPALIRATWLARQSDASIHLLICYYNEFLSGARFMDSTSLQEARAKAIEKYRLRLEDIADPLRASGLTVTTQVVWDHPLYEGIVRQAMEHEADVVFKDTHYHSALSRALFTNTDWSLIRTCPVPLWLVSPRDIFNKPNVIASVDPFNEHDKPAALDDQILIISNAIAEDINGKTHAFHAYDSRIALSTASANAYIPVSLPLDEIEIEVRDQHQGRFVEVTNFHGIPEHRTHLVSGFAHEELPELAKELDAGLVVMGAVSRNGLKRLFIGATAEKTLPFLPCDLLIIKPHPFISPVEIESSEPVEGARMAQS